MVNPAQQSWTGGELSPKMYGRTDVQQYFNGARRIENWIVETQGAVKFRSGFQYISGTKDNQRAFLYRFQFSDIQAYVLEFTQGNIRIYRDRGVLTDGGVPIDIPSPYQEDELFDLKFAQNAASLYIAHPNHPPQIVTRTIETSWTLAPQPIVGFVPELSPDNYPSCVAFYEERVIYGATNELPETLWFSRSGEADDFTIGTEADDGIRYTIAASDDVNRPEWIRGTEDFLAVGGFGDVLRVTGGEGQSAVTPTSISIRPTNTYGCADINPISAKQAVMYIQRNRRTLFSLEIEDITGIYRPVDRNIFADHVTLSGITQMAYQEDRPDVLWSVRSDGQLLGLTIAFEQEVSGWHRHTTDGKFISIATTPRDNDYDTLWACVEREIDGVTQYSIEHLNDFQDYPVLSDFVTGQKNQREDFIRFQRAMFEAQKKYIHLDSALTYDGSVQGVDAGASLTVSAVAGTGVNITSSVDIFSAGDVGREIRVKSIDGSKQGIAVISSFVNGSSVNVDVLVDFTDLDVLAPDHWYITTGTLSGIDHLEGKEVGVLIDGAVHPKVIVTNGQVELDQQGSVVHVGLPYVGTVESMNLEGGAQLGTSQTKKMNTGRVGVRLLDTAGLSFGSDYYRLENRLLREAVDLMDTPPPLITGDELINFRDGSSTKSTGWDRGKRVIFQQDLPLPATVQLITPHFEVSET